MFWKKKSAAEAGTSLQPEAEKLHGPQDLPMPVGRDIVTKLHKDPDLVWRLKCVMRPNPRGKKVSDVRVFNEADAAKKKVKVKDYLTLDAYPDLILFEGWIDGAISETQIVERRA